MKRGNFLKSIFGIGVVAALSPLQITQSKTEYKFNELFDIHEGNERLIHFKSESEFYRKLESLIQSRILSKDSFRYYLPKHDVQIPVKDLYTFEDFMPIIYCLNGYYNKDSKYATYSNNVFFRFVKNNDLMHLDLYAA